MFFYPQRLYSIIALS